MSGDAREDVLGRIRAALGPGHGRSSPAVDADWHDLPRDYAQPSRLSAEARLNLLQDRLLDYDAEVTRAAPDEVANVVAAILRARGGQPVLVPTGFPEAWKPAGVPLTEDRNLSPRELDAFEAVLTTATLAIADTGTLVLQNVAGQGRRAATLVPDFHLCVLRAADVVQTVPEAFAVLAATATLPTTFVSGPSATADIEMTRIKGVHGPRFLHIVVVLNKTKIDLSVSN